MASIYKLTKNGQTIYPATTTRAVVDPDLGVTVPDLIEEINVSKIFPTDGIDGTNRYTLETAIAKIPESLRKIGIKCSFLDEGGSMETYLWKGGTFTSASAWSKVPGEKELDELDKKDRFPVYPVQVPTGGTPLEDVMDGIYSFGRGLEESPSYHIGYKTYKYTTDSSSVNSIIAFKPEGANYEYRTYAIFDSNGNIVIEQAIRNPEQWFVARIFRGQTIVVTSSVVPLLAPSFKSVEEYVEEYMEEYVEEYMEENPVNNKIVPSKNTLVGKSSGVTIEFNEKNNLTRQLSWQAHSIGIGNYAFCGLNPMLKFYPQGIYTFIVKNTGQNRLKIGVGLTKNSFNWNNGFLVSETYTINPGETIEKSFSYNDWDNIESLEDISEVSLLVVLYGNLSANALAKDGSIEVSYLYNIFNFKIPKSTTAEYAEKAQLAEVSNLSCQSEKSYNSSHSANAGFVIGALSENAEFRDVYPSGGSPGAITLEKTDARTVKLTTNFSADEIGSKYRGVYWKITYENLEDLKGKWIFKCSYTNYTSTYLNKAMLDWGTDVDIIKLDVPLGNNESTIYDFYSLIMDYKNAHLEDGKWTGILETQGYLYFQPIKYMPNGMVNPFHDLLTLDFIPESTRVIATELSQELSDKIDNNTENKIQSAVQELKGGIISVTNWGDSLTAGAGASNHTHQETVLDAIRAKGYPDLDLTDSEKITYSIMMQKLLGSKYKVTNCGVGGENINTIAARLGANVAYASEDFVLPQDETPVQIGTYSSRLNSAWGTQVSPLLQGEGNSVNPCYVQGIECTLKWNSSGSGEGTYTLQRVKPGDRNVSFSSKTPIIMSGSKLYRNTKLAVLWCWQNGGYSSNTDELLEKLDKIISHIGTSNYLLIGLHSGTASSRAEQEEALTKKYGDKYFNWREYASTNALYDFGLSPTAEDLEAMAQGSMPKTLLLDSVHLISAGYAILGYKIIERFKDLGYVP